jgi:hypothetical protein
MRHRVYDGAQRDITAMSTSNRPMMGSYTDDG